MKRRTKDRDAVIIDSPDLKLEDMLRAWYDYSVDRDRAGTADIYDLIDAWSDVKDPTPAMVEAFVREKVIPLLLKDSWNEGGDR